MGGDEKGGKEERFRGGVGRGGEQKCVQVGLPVIHVHCGGWKERWEGKMSKEREDEEAIGW